MRPSLRFLAIVVVGWVGARSAMLGAFPGGEMFSLGTVTRRPPPIIPTEFPAIAPVADSGHGEDQPGWFEAEPAPTSQPPRARPGPLARMASAASQWLSWAPAQFTGSPGIVPASAPIHYPLSTVDEWPLSRLAAASSSPLGSMPRGASQSFPVRIEAAKLDRIQLTAWALLRGQQALTSAPDGLASGSTLGGSQAGARLAYNFNRQLAATVRSTSTIGRRGGEVALGARIQPIGGIPVWLTAERRFALGRYGGGRNAFALFFEGGLWNTPLPLEFRLDAYAQAGVVGLKRRDAFVDGAVTATRPVYRNFSAGLGLWGGAQPGVYRVDAGPRITMRVRDNIAVHFDYRHRLAGNAEPGSGPAVTLAADF